MNPIEFPQANVKLVGPEGENDPNVKPMAAHANNGIITSCWELSDDEIAELVETKKIYLMVLSGNQAPPPVMMQVSDPFIKNKLGFCIVPFEILDDEGNGTGQFIHVWNSRDGEIVETINIENKKLKLNTSIPGFVPQAVLQFTAEMYKTTKYMFRDPSETEINEHVAKLLARPQSEWPKLIDKNGEVINPPRNAEEYLKQIIKNIPILDVIIIKETQIPTPNFEKGGTGFDGNSDQEAVVKPLNSAK